MSGDPGVDVSSTCQNTRVTCLVTVVCCLRVVSTCLGRKRSVVLVVIDCNLVNIYNISTSVCGISTLLNIIFSFITQTWSSHQSSFNSKLIWKLHNFSLTESSCSRVICHCRNVNICYKWPAFSESHSTTTHHSYFQLLHSHSHTMINAWPDDHWPKYASRR